MQVNIRPLRESDAQTSVKWRNIPEIWVHTTFKATREITLEDELAWVKKVTADPHAVRFAILADGVYVGNTYLTDIHDGVGEFHIFIGERDYWGKGIATQAAKLVIEYAKNELNLTTLELGVREDNAAALSIYHRLGFAPAGRDGQFLRMSLQLVHDGAKGSS